MQGKRLFDLARSVRVREIVCADVSLKDWDRIAAFTDVTKIKPVQVDGSSEDALVALFEQGFDAVIDLLPQPFMINAFDAAIETGCRWSARLRQARSSTCTSRPRPPASP